MKLKHVVASFALAAITSLGVVAGLSAHKEAKEVKADTVTVSDDMTFYYIDNWGLNTPYFYEFDSTGPVGWPGVAMTDTGKTFEYTEGQSAKVWSFEADAETYPNFIINNNNGTQTKNMQWSWFDGLTGNAFLHHYDQGESLRLVDYAEFAISVDSVKTVLQRNWSNTQSVEYKLPSDIALDPAKPISFLRNDAAYAVTMKADVDNNYNNGSVVDSQVVVHNAATTNIYLDTDSAQVWVGGFEFDPEQNVTVYLLAEGYSDLYLYTYKNGGTSKAMGTFPGTMMEACSGIGYKFGGAFYGIYKVTFPGESVDDYFEFSDGTNAHQQIVSRSEIASTGYVFNFNTGSLPGGRLNALKAVITLQLLVESIPANELAGTVQGSTCGVTQELAASIVSSVELLTKDLYAYVLEEVNASTIYLVSSKDGLTHANYTFAEIMAALEVVASGSSRVININNSLESNSTTMIIIIAISTLSVASLATLLVLKKKRK